jgi:hypothetical protein
MLHTYVGGAKTPTLFFFAPEGRVDEGFWVTRVVRRHSFSNDNWDLGGDSH